MDETKQTDEKKLIIFTIHKAPKLPTIRTVNDGDDVDKMLHEELGDEIFDDTLDADDKELGLLRMARNADGVMAHVHSDPQAEEELRSMVEGMKTQLRLFDALRAAGIVTGEPREDGCLCGHCPPRGTKSEPAERN